MTFGVLIDTITTQEGRTQKIYEYLRFTDSYKMMNSSPEKLVKILPDTHLDIMKAMFPSVSYQTHTYSNKKDIILILMYVIVQSYLRNVYQPSQNGATY